jgi:hypothetical protein
MIRMVIIKKHVSGLLGLYCVLCARAELAVASVFRPGPNHKSDARSAVTQSTVVAIDFECRPFCGVTLYLSTYLLYNTDKSCFRSVSFLFYGPAPSPPWREVVEIDVVKPISKSDREAENARLAD